MEARKKKTRAHIIPIAAPKIPPSTAAAVLTQYPIVATSPVTKSTMVAQARHIMK